MKYIFWEQYNAQSISGLPKLIIMGVKAVGKFADVALICNPQSIVYGVLRNEGVRFEHIDDADLENTDLVCSDDILIVQSLRPILFSLHRQNPRVLLWQIYPRLGVTGWSLFMVKQQMRFAISRGAFMSMDRICYDTFFEETGLHPNYIVPMPIDHCDYCYRYKVSAVGSREPLRISYLGRAVDWKVYALIRMLKDLAPLDGAYEVNVYTDSAESFSRLVGDACPANTYINYHEGYYGQRLLNAMAETDLHMAMGISTLEGSAMGIPTIVASIAYSAIPDGYRYHWLSEDPEYYAGDMVENDMKKSIGHSLADIIADIRNADKCMRVSRECYDAACQYSLESVGRQLVGIDTRLTLRQCNWMQGAYWKGKLKNAK